jgi:hypothetical protein
VLPLPAKRRGRWGNRSGRSDDPATRRKVRLRGRPNVSVNSQYKPPTGREGGRVAVGVSSLRRAGFTSFIVNEYRHLKHYRPGQDRRDGGGLPGGGAVIKLRQRGHPSGRRPRHGFALTRESSSHLQAPWRDFFVFKVTRRTGGATDRRESWRGEERGRLGRGEWGRWSPASDLRVTRSWGFGGGGFGSLPTPLSPLPPDCAPIGSGQLGQHAVLPLYPSPPYSRVG